MSETLGTLIKAKREKVGLSIRQLAEKAGLHYSYLSRIESGDRERLRPDDIQRIADALSIEPDRLLRFMGVKPTATKLPTPRVYFRKAYHLTSDEAKEAERQVEGILDGLRKETKRQDNKQRPDKKPSNHTNQPRGGTAP